MLELANIEETDLAELRLIGYSFSMDEDANMEVNVNPFCVLSGGTYCRQEVLLNVLLNDPTLLVLISGICTNLKQLLNIASMFKALLVLKAGMVFKIEQSENIPAKLVTLLVSKCATVSSKVHRLNMFLMLVALLVFSKGSSFNDVQFANAESKFCAFLHHSVPFTDDRFVEPLKRLLQLVRLVGPIHSNSCKKGQADVPPVPPPIDSDVNVLDAPFMLNHFGLAWVLMA